jgi:hypothetical protein
VGKVKAYYIEFEEESRECEMEDCEWHEFLDRQEALAKEEDYGQDNE